MSDSFTIQHCHNGIIKFRIYNLTPESAAAWELIVQQLYCEAIQQGQHLRILYDMRDAGIPPREVANAMIRTTHALPDNFSRSSAILTLPHMLGLMEREVRRLPRRSVQNVKLFLTEQEALAWLEGRHEAIAS